MGEARPSFNFALGLPGELQDEILDYIELKSDLKSLCLTSKALMKLAYPRLYRRIVINARSRDQVQIFNRADSRGLQHTRSVTFLDVTHKLLGDTDEYTAAHKLSDEEMKQTIHLLIGRFPNNKLTSFRFLSKKVTLLLDTMSMLEKYQSSLQHLDLPVGDYGPDNTLKWNPNFLFLRARTLELLVHSFGTSRKFQKFLSRLFFGHTSQLERLSLCLDLNNLPNRNLDDMSHDLSKATDVTINRHDKLKELTLIGVPLSHSTWFMQMLNVSIITSLSLIDCIDDAEFLQSFGYQATGSSLRHLFVEFSNYPSTEEADSCLSNIYQYCQRLESLHLAWSADQTLGCTISQSVDFGPRLRSLSLHRLDDIDDDDTTIPSLPVQDLMAICSSCSQLRQLGYRVHDKAINTRRWDTPDPMLLPDYVNHHSFPELNVLTALPELEILHLRQHRSKLWGIEEEALTALQLQESVFQKFANEFFGYLDHHGLCPKLKLIVWGSAIADTFDRTDVELEKIPQRCFIKGKQVDAIGRIKTVGVPISMNEIRQAFIANRVDVLDYDPESKWIGRLPGRFHDP